MLFALWWLYFLVPAGEGLNDRRHRSYRWGYGHYGIFASLAALGAGLEVAVAQTGHDLEASPLAVCYAVAVPTALFVMLLWKVHTPILAAPVLRPAVVVPGVAAVLLMPSAAARVGVATVIAAIAALAVVMTVLTIAPGDNRSPRQETRAAT
ncbi:low temperature requirement protein A [Actinomadura luteofluorescens]|uniref:low temperature requirement protein A n=1 Tax=Actinomadura luteofluorescens TaxID=46163 RepID=UPI003630AE95